ncbi:MAG: AEC family transporter [Rhizobiaceae bacterium]
MIATFESILPIFLLIVAGNLLRHVPLVDARAWPGLEQLGFWFLYPALLFVTIVNADFSALNLDTLVISLAAAIGAMIVLALCLWPPLNASGLVARSEFSSVFQTTIRWNGFMAFAIAQKLFEPEGLAVVALVMAAIIMPINIASIAVIVRFGSSRADWGGVARKTATNPLVLASLAALIVRAQPYGFYEPFNQTLDLVGRAALGMGLIAIGAGLRPADLWQPRVAMWLPVVLKLAVYPAILIGTAVAMGLSGPQLTYLALCGAVPTAMNGYLLARQMGGDAELYAAVTTMQTIISFFSIPAVLAIAAMLAGA